MLHKWTLVVLMEIVFVGPASSNYLTNPGFESSPWDNGWSSETWGGLLPSSAVGAHGGGVCAKLEESGTLTTETVDNYGWLWQTIQPYTSCSVSVWYKYVISLRTSGNPDLYGGYDETVEIQVKNRGNWQTEWGKHITGYDVYIPTEAGDSNKVWTLWGKRYTSSDTISGIRFYARCYIWIYGSDNIPVRATIWVDDADIEGGAPTGVEVNNVTNGCQNIEIYPNPFSKKTIIRYQTSEARGTKQEARLTIYDLCGRLVRTLPILATQYSLPVSIVWDGTADDGNKLPSGIYFCKLQTENESLTEQLLLVR